jgi:orotidine-5'-phosphate decarboxylase
MTTFLERLDNACEANRSLLCVGLDPEPGRLPVDNVLDFNRAIVEATTDLAAAYKPNLAFYEALGLPGLRALEGTIQAIREAAPQALIIGDAKRGDGGPSAAAYARAMFQVWGFDSVTVNPWGGGETLKPFLEDASKGVFVWCRGSYASAADLQDLEVASPYGKTTMYEHVARTSLEWNDKGNVGLVLGATVPDQLAAIRKVCPDSPFLIPGIGAQGGDLEASVRCGVNANGRRAVINSSRSIIYASDGADFARASRQSAASLRDAINRILETEGKGWPSK